MNGRSRGEAACVAGLVFLCAGFAIGCLELGVLSVGGMVWEGVDEHRAWPSWPALALVLMAPPFGLFGAVVVASGALAVGAVLAAAALLRRVLKPRTTPPNPLARQSASQYAAATISTSGKEHGP